MKLPNFVVIGAPKSGTTSLFFYLRQHPDIYLPVRKELHYFTYELFVRYSNGPGDKQILPLLCANRQEYESQYINVGSEKAIGEVSPSYLHFSEVSSRIHSELWPVKIIALLRNPIEKAYSHYMHLVRETFETLPFYDALLAEEERIARGWGNIWWYAEGSLYTERIKKYLSTFGKENVKIILFDEFVGETDRVMREIFEFLSVDPGFQPDTALIYNRTGKPKSKLVANFLARPNFLKSIGRILIPDQLRMQLRFAVADLNTHKKEAMDIRAEQYLQEYFQADVTQLEMLLSKKLNWLDD